LLPLHHPKYHSYTLFFYDRQRDPTHRKLFNQSKAVVATKIVDLAKTNPFGQFGSYFFGFLVIVSLLMKKEKTNTSSNPSLIFSVYLF
jgi:type II secretory pathway component GspD/PulD (secretin)